MKELLENGRYLAKITDVSQVIKGFESIRNALN
jgi:hypothetical protein